MRRALGLLLLASLLSTGLLTGCATDEVRSAPEDSPPRTGRVEFTQVALVSRSAAGGEVDERATVLEGPRAVQRFAAQFRTDAMRDALRAAVAGSDVPDGETLVGAVVMLGCDRPAGVSVARRGGGLEIVALAPATTHPECFVAVTTVALVSVDSALLAG